MIECFSFYVFSENDFWIWYLIKSVGAELRTVTFLINLTSFGANLLFPTENSGMRKLTEQFSRFLYLSPLCNCWGLKLKIIWMSRDQSSICQVSEAPDS